MVAVSAARVVRVLFPLYLQQRPTGWRRLQKLSKLELGMDGRGFQKPPSCSSTEASDPCAKERYQQGDVLYSLWRRGRMDLGCLSFLAEMLIKLTSHVVYSFLLKA